jgi:hypothetical protein
MNDGGDKEFIAHDLNDQKMAGVLHPPASHVTSAVADMIVKPWANASGSKPLRILTQVSDGLDNQIFVSATGIRAEPPLTIRENSYQL